MTTGFVTIHLAAEILGVSTETLRLWDDKGILPATRDPKNHYRLYAIQTLEAYAAKHNLKRGRRATLDTTD